MAFRQDWMKLRDGEHFKPECGFINQPCLDGRSFLFDRNVNATKKLVASHEAVGYTVAMICRSSEKGKGGSCIEKWYFLWRLSAKPNFI